MIQSVVTVALTAVVVMLVDDEVRFRLAARPSSTFCAVLPVTAVKVPVALPTVTV